MSKKGKFTLSLCMIVRNEAENLPTLWQSIKGVVDEWIVVDTGSTDATVETARKLGAKVIEAHDEFNTKLTEDHVKFFSQYGIKATVGENVFEFGKARSFSFNQATKDFILWLDADDIFVGRDKLVEIMNENLDPAKQLGLHLLYKYEFDSYRNCTVQHYRERVIPNNKTFQWTGRIHEILTPTIECQYIRVQSEHCHVMHNAINKIDSSNDRNIKHLLLDLYEQGDKPDPRTLFFLAEALSLRGDSDRAIKLYEQYVPLSGWDEERCIACVRLSKIYLKQNDHQKSLEWAFRAVREKPDFPTGYSAVAQAYYSLGELEYSIKFSEAAINTNQPDTVHFVDEKYDKFIPLYILASVYLQKSMFREALSFCKHAMDWEPLNEELRKIQYTCERMFQEDEIVKALGKTTEFLKDEGELEKAMEVIKRAPAALSEDPRIMGIQKEIQGEMDKRSQGWVSEEKRLQDGKPIDVQYKLLVTDLKKFQCKSVLLFSNEPMLAAWLKHQGFHTKRVIKFEQADGSYDAVFFDFNLHMIQDREKWIREGMGRATKLFGLCVPNRDPNAIVQCTVSLVEQWMNRPWNLMPLGNGVIYASEPIARPNYEKKITFFCGGGSTEPWGPLSHVQGGCGGSEEATIYLTRELALKGYDLEVINSYPVTCFVEGVKWRHISTIRPDEEFDTCILWRIPHHIDEYQLKAKQFFLWMHDVPESFWFTPERLEKITKIIALSKYHRSLLPEIPDEKFIISSNGVELSQFLQQVERNPKKVIYTSSYDRGLEHLLKIWPSVREAVPDAELHVYYGWGTYDKLRTEPKQREWKSWMMEQFKLPGVTEHGRIDQVQLATELLSSSVFAYPCHFEEISCISAMKSQAAGCIPLTTDYAALAETNLFEIQKIHGNPNTDPRVMESFKTQLVAHLNGLGTSDEIREKIAKAAWNKFSWKNVAEQWSNFIVEGSNVRN